MGFWRYARDMLSGTIYKTNKIVGPNTVALLDKTQKLPDSNFAKHWAVACILSCEVSLDSLLFRKYGSATNTFKKNIGKLNVSKVFEIMKLLTGAYLSVFKRKEKSANFLNELNISIEKMEKDIFYVFSFSHDDEKLFRKLDKEFDEDLNKYFLHLYQKIFEKAYEMSDTKDADGYFLLVSTIFYDYTRVFTSFFSNELKKTSKGI